MNNDAEDARSLSRYLVAEYLNKNDGINFLNKKGSESGQPRSLRRLEAFLEIETKKGEFYLQIHAYSHLRIRCMFTHLSTSRTKEKEPKKPLLERIIQCYLQKSREKIPSNSSFSKTEEMINGAERKSLLHRPKTSIQKSPNIRSNSIDKQSSSQVSESHQKRSSIWNKKVNNSLSRPSTASPPMKNRRLTRPKTVSPNFHRRRIKVRPPRSDGKHKSKESWIPEEIRQKMFKRELAVAMVNFEAKETCNSSMKHIAQRDSDSLERSLSKEKFGIEHRKPCGLCCVKFLPVNLVLAVPLKAVLDIRDSWGDKFDPEGSRRVRVNPNLRKAPACYNSTRVCAFCAQLFDQQQEAYRPSWEAKEAEKERIKDLEEAARRKVENDPLSQIEKERDAELNRALSRQKIKETIDHTRIKTPTRRTSDQSQSHF